MNIVLIGMPGCGKSTIGKMLAERLNREFVDCDEYVEEKSGMTIPEIFEKYGESEFRRREIEAAAELGQRKDLVISTGGGCVERRENIDSFKENGVIVFIDRSIENIFSDIDVSGRPLLADKKDRLNELYTRRLPLYREYCSVRTENNGSIDDTIEKIIKETEKL